MVALSAYIAIIDFFIWILFSRIVGVKCSLLVKFVSSVPVADVWLHCLRYFSRSTCRPKIHRMKNGLVKVRGYSSKISKFCDYNEHSIHCSVIFDYSCWMKWATLSKRVLGWPLCSRSVPECCRNSRNSSIPRWVVSAANKSCCPCWRLTLCGKKQVPVQTYLSLLLLNLFCYRKMGVDRLGALHCHRQAWSSICSESGESV